MFHLAAFVNSALGTVADTDIAAIADDQLTITNSHVVVPENVRLIGAYAGSPTLIRAKFGTPSMRQIAEPFIRPTSTNLLPPTNANMAIWDWSPYQIQEGEELQVKATANPGTTEAFYALAWLQRQYRPIPPGPITPLRATSTTAAVSGVWTSVALTWADTIPAGRYAMVLSEVFSTNAIAHRWLFDDQTFRPGFISGAAPGLRLTDGVNKGQFGILGYFRQNQMPRLQVLVNGTDAVHTVFAHVQRVGGGAF